MFSLVAPYSERVSHIHLSPGEEFNTLMKLHGRKYRFSSEGVATANINVSPLEEMLLELCRPSASDFTLDQIYLPMKSGAHI